MGIERATATARDRPSRPAVEAPAAWCAPGFDVALNPATLGALVGGADGGTRERLARIPQARHGNAAVQRRLAPGGALPVQRWAVTLVTVPDRTIKAFRAAVQAEWNTWIGQHQAAQTAIDPYTAVLDCSGGESESGGTSAAPIASLDEEPDLGGE